jgi:hypothetical protein
MVRLLYLVIEKMAECVECGKRLGFFEGYSHPTLGKKSLVCGLCFDKVEESVARWREFVLSNSFNPESSEPALSVNWSSLFTRLARIRKILNRAEKKKSSHDACRGSNCKMAMTQMNHIGKKTSTQLGGRSV